MKPVTPVDPLAVFASLQRPTPSRPRRPVRFASGEHAWLGDAGAADAARALRAEGVAIADRDFEQIPRRRGRDTFSYGELVALSGDFYGSAEELFSETPRNTPWWPGDNDLPELRKLFDEELRWIAARQRGHGTAAYPENSVQIAWHAKAYIELALDNVDHFGWHNVVAYCRHHAAALELARAAKGKAGPLWAKARVFNAFADHFLTDAFAAGHVRVPRAELRAWAKREGLSDALAGALSKLLHDQDGHVVTLHGVEDDARAPQEGLPVRNARGIAWRTRCDGQLFLFPRAMETATGRIPARAVSESVKELVRAWRTGALPDGIYAATREVPFPDPRAPGLSDKFPATMPKERLDALYESVSWYSKLPWIGPALKRAHLPRLFRALPGLMGELRTAVDAAVRAEPELSRRMPAAYLEAFRAVR